MKTQLYIGTSGFYYKHWKGLFYPEQLPQSSWLSYYSTRFNCVELNVTFYRLPAKKTFTRWYTETPEGFKFVLKGSRFITHIKKLTDCEQALEQLTAHAAELKQKLLGFLWQLPPSFKIDAERLSSFLKLLGKLSPHCFHSFEFRHSSWMNEAVYNVLRQYNASLCIADSPSFPYAEKLTSRTCYVRFHGGKQLYGSEYSAKELSDWAYKLRSWFSVTDTMLIFFNNDAEGFAVHNAQTLMQMIR